MNIKPVGINNKSLEINNKILEIPKTLIGKNNYLFLQNDESHELETHIKNICVVSDSFFKRYEKYINKFLLIVLPNKSFIYKEFLPNNYNLQYRPNFNKYNEYLKNNILDGYNILVNTDDTYYKTDTHINLNGNYLIYLHFIDKINELFKLNIIKKEYKINCIECNSLAQLNKGIGDLTWYSNLGNQILNDISDKYYFFEDIEEIYLNYKINNDSNNIIRLLLFQNNILIDDTINNINNIIDWNIVSKYILYKKNNIDNNLKVLIFYDSFLLSMLPIIINLFGEVYLSKSIFNSKMIDSINPDYIFEFRCERFLF
jgi:hypothetical protein